jgi:hypothetical protein
MDCHFQQICTIIRLVIRVCLYEDRNSKKLYFKHIDDIKAPSKLQPIIQAILQ